MLPSESPSNNKLILYYINLHTFLSLQSTSATMDDGILRNIASRVQLHLVAPSKLAELVLSDSLSTSQVFSKGGNYLTLAENLKETKRRLHKKKNILPRTATAVL